MQVSPDLSCPILDDAGQSRRASIILATHSAIRWARFMRTEFREAMEVMEVVIQDGAKAARAVGTNKSLGLRQAGVGVNLDSTMVCASVDRETFR
jgi:hypothetical protein